MKEASPTYDACRDKESGGRGGEESAERHIYGGEGEAVGGARGGGGSREGKGQDVEEANIFL